MKKARFKQRLSYWFDNVMSRGTVALVGLLFLFTLAVVVIVACISHFALPESTQTLGGSLWQSLMRVLDAGNVAGDYESGSAVYVILMVIATVCGLFVTSILIGIINAAFESKLSALRKGNSQVLESGHTLILGFDMHIYSVLSELIVANENEKRPCIVILADMDKEEMEQALHANLESYGNTRIICRSGDITGFASLKNVAIESCAQVVVLAEDDFTAIKTVLAAATIMDEDCPDSPAHITAVIRDEKSLDAVRIAGGKRLEVLYFDSAISRIIAQTCRQSGLSLVYQELFDFEGCEIYMEPAPRLCGKPFSEIPLYYENASVMGVRRGGNVMLNPDPAIVVGENDDIILIAEDDGVAKPLPAPGTPDSSLFAKRNGNPSCPESMLILGYNRFTANILKEVNAYAMPGSRVTIATPYTEAQEEIAGLILPNLAVEVIENAIYQRQVLYELLQREFDYVIVLTDMAEEGDPDARTLMLLLQLRDIERETGRQLTIISEMQQSANQKLAACTHVNDFVIGSNLISLMMTQVCKNRSLSAVFEELLTDNGCEIYMRPAEDYVKTGVPVDFYTVTASALARRELCLGYKTLDASGKPQIFINPAKSASVTLAADDKLIVIADD